MSSMKSDIYITVQAGGKSFSIGGVKMLDGRYKIKRGRSWSERRQFATLRYLPRRVNGRLNRVDSNKN